MKTARPFMRIVALVGDPLHIAILMNGLAVFIGSQISP
jgi:hypothetical protein